MESRQPTAEADRGGSEAGQGRPDPIPVLFIAGAGRSGSTLLDRVIGMHDGFLSMGELYFIWERSFGENQLCGCGAPFLECEFWERVSRASFGVGSAEFDPARAIGLKDRIGWKRYVLRRGARAFGGGYGAALEAYGEVLLHLYGGIRSVTGCRVIVDSSKDPVHGFVLSQTPGFEVHVVHLVRDPRAVAFSWRRSRRRPEVHWANEEMPKERIYTSSIRWSGENALVEWLGRSVSSYCRIRYEDFVVDPDSALDEVFSPYDWMTGGRRRLSDLAVELEPTHTVSGNPMRFQRGKVELKVDSEWQGAMTASDRRVVTATAWPLMVHYRYPLRLIRP